MPPELQRPGFPEVLGPSAAPPTVQDGASVADARLAGMWEPSEYYGAKPGFQLGSWQVDDLRNTRLPLPMSPEDRNLFIVCVSSVLACAFILQGGENLLQGLSQPQYAVLRRNTETLGLQQALSDAWAGKPLQRELMTVVEMTE